MVILALTKMYWGIACCIMATGGDSSYKTVVYRREQDDSSSLEGISFPGKCHRCYYLVFFKTKDCIYLFQFFVSATATIITLK
jgi:hypothetical protein